MAEQAPTLVIVNPASAGGATEQRWPVVRDLLFRHMGFEVAFSQYAGHAIELGRQAREQGYRRLVCVGGDGTVNEVVNGVLSAPPSQQPLPEFGVIPSGTGSDLVRSLGIPHDLQVACARLGEPRRATIDLGVVCYRGKEGLERRYFVNAAGLGYDAEVVSRRNGFNRHIRGTVPYLVSLGLTLLFYRNKDVIVTVDGVQDARRVLLLVLAIGRFFGGGMRIAPHAVLDDGRFDVVTLGDVGRLELLYNVPGVYRGAHLRNPKVRVERAALVGVDSDQPVLIQADGELLGLAPAQFQIVPRALTILC